MWTHNTVGLKTLTGYMDIEISVSAMEREAKAIKWGVQVAQLF